VSEWRVGGSLPPSTIQGASCEDFRGQEPSRLWHSSPAVASESQKPRCRNLLEPPLESQSPPGVRRGSITGMPGYGEDVMGGELVIGVTRLTVNPPRNGGQVHTHKLWGHSPRHDLKQILIIQFVNEQEGIRFLLSQIWREHEELIHTSRGWGWSDAIRTNTSNNYNTHSGRPCISSQKYFHQTWFQNPTTLVYPLGPLHTVSY